MRALVFVGTLSLVAAGCGGGDHAPSDGGAPADMTPTGCQPTFGRSFIVSQFTQPPTNEGFDLDGDGTPDNAFGAIGDNKTWADVVSSGGAIFLWDTAGLGDPGTPLADGAPVSLAFYL